MNPARCHCATPRKRKAPTGSSVSGLMCRWAAGFERAYAIEDAGKLCSNSPTGSSKEKPVLSAIRYLQFRWFTAKVAAELKAQHNDPAFLSSLLTRPSNLDAIRQCRFGTKYWSLNVGPFLCAAAILATTLDDDDSPREFQILCGRMLADRLTKMQTDPNFVHRFGFQIYTLTNSLRSAAERLDLSGGATV